MRQPITRTRTSPVASQQPAAELSLERKLPLLISGLLLLVLIVFSWGAYVQVKQSALIAASERLQRLTRQLSDLLATSVAQRSQAMRGVAADSAIHALLRAPGAAASAGALTRLRHMGTPADSELVVAVLDAQGRQVLTGGSSVPADAGTVLEVIEASQHPDSVHYGRFYTAADSVFYWVVAPVLDGRLVLGHIAQRRRLVSQPRVEQQIRELSGEDVTIYFATDSGSAWTTLSGVTSAAPLNMRRTRSSLLEYERARRGAHLAARAPITGTPWMMILDVPLSVVLRGAKSYLGRMSLLAACLVLAGAAGAWIVSRHVTRPLALLTLAAEAVAAGDYGERVTIARRDELGRLGETFNVMAARIEESLQELEQQAEELEEAATELEMTNEQLRHANDALAKQTRAHESARTEAVAASQAKSDFLAVMSHELRTPLNAILGFSNLLIDGITGPISGAQHSQLVRIRASGEHLLSLIDEILSLSRVEAGQEGVYLETADACELARDTAALIEPMAAAKALRLETRIPAGPHLMRTDLTKVRQIVLNLLANAVKFTPAGAVTLAVTAADGRVTFEVRDTGIGIASEALGRIFEPFYQVEQAKSRRAPGTGLGLSVTRHLARLLGGDIEVTSEVGSGSAFRVWLPVAAPAVAPASLGQPLQTTQVTRARQTV